MNTPRINLTTLAATFGPGVFVAQKAGLGWDYVGTFGGRRLAIFAQRTLGPYGTTVAWLWAWEPAGALHDLTSLAALRRQLRRGTRD